MSLDMSNDLQFVGGYVYCLKLTSLFSGNSSLLFLDNLFQKVHVGSLMVCTTDLSIICEIKKYIDCAKKCLSLHKGVNLSS